VAGEAGDLVVSNLVNDATVLLNYRLGDTVALLPGACRCGRTLPRMAQPLGRLDDWLSIGGRRVHSQGVRTIFTSEADILQYQVVQREPWKVVVSVVARGGFDEAGTTRRIVRGFQERFTDRLQVDVTFVSDLPRTSRGKVRAIVPLDEAHASVHVHAPT
jgi:phenylacetate-CoA ligase